MMNHRCIPPFLLSDGSRITPSMPVYLPRKITALEKDSVHGGISAFGFGGINAHLYLSTCQKKEQTAKGSRVMTEEPLILGHAETSIVLLGQSTLEMNRLAELEKDFDLRIPLKSYPQIDPLQRLAIIATKKAFDSAGIDLDLLDRDTIGVVSGSATGQEVARNLTYRLNYAQMNAPFDEFRYDRNLLLALRSRYPPATEDTGIGMLNNVIAGRVANYFNFRGLSCNVDYDEASEAAALAVAKTHLQDHGGLMVVIGSNDMFHSQFMCFIPCKVNVFLISTLSFAEEHGMAVISVLKGVYRSDR
jgi:acyl transferase domain-containing protein